MEIKEACVTLSYAERGQFFATFFRTGGRKERENPLDGVIILTLLPNAK
jgi:hypothetical protein